MYIGQVGTEVTKNQGGAKRVVVDDILFEAWTLAKESRIGIKRSFHFDTVVFLRPHDSNCPEVGRSQCIYQVIQQHADVVTMSKLQEFELGKVNVPTKLLEIFAAVERESLQVKVFGL